MVSHSNSSNELYNLRWNSYFSNLVSVFNEHQSHESLVDVTLGCEGQFIKAHRLVLSACSAYFQKVFQTHKEPQLLILLNDVKFDNLSMVVQFMYKGEVKVADADMPQLLQLGKMLQIKGLCSVELQNKQKHAASSDKKCKEADVPPENSTNKKSVSVENEPKNKDHEKSSGKKRKLSSPSPVDYKIRLKVTSPDLKESQKTASSEPKEDKKLSNSEPNGNKKLASPEPNENQRLPSPVPLDLKKKPVSVIVSPSLVDNTDPKNVSHIPRPPNAFMIFANQWRKKLAVEYPHESNKDISVRLGNMWKSLSQETKDAFYEDAKKADEEHKLRFPGYYYSPKEARHRKAIQNITKPVNKTDSVKDDSGDITEMEFIEIKCEDDRGDYEHSLNNGKN